MENLKAPFPYFGGKSKASELVWSLFGDVQNYVEPFCGSAAMLLCAPESDRVETINDFDGFVANFWRSIVKDYEAVADYADWPVNEVDLFSRHLWLVNQRQRVKEQLTLDPEWCDAKVAGWWVWGLCAWIGHGWCQAGSGSWINDGLVVRQEKGNGINKQLPHLSRGQGINRQLPHLGNKGQGINRKHKDHATRRQFIFDWFERLHNRLRDVRVASGDWKRVLGDAVTTLHGLTGVFLDPPYEKGDMNYGEGGMNQEISAEVRSWCIANGKNPLLRIVLCGHDGEHDDLINHGWQKAHWKAGKGYAKSEEAKANYKGETVWYSPHCLSHKTATQHVLF